MRSLRPVLVSLLLLLMVVLAPAAQAAQPAVNLAGAPTTASVNAVLATGAKQVRFFVSWADLEPDGPGTYGTAGASQSARDLSTVYDQAIQQLNAAGAEPIFVVLRAPRWANGSDDQLVPPTDPNDYAHFLAAWAAHNQQVGTVAAYEVWNEPDEAVFWHPGPDAVKYTALLKAAYAAAKPMTSAAILTGPTSGNDYAWIEQLYAQGAKGSFDGVSVHTDTACLNNAPSDVSRDSSEGGRVSRFSFLGYREVRASMLAQGDDKPIWMTELGWSSTDGGPTSCQRGAGTGMRPSGVSEATQAQYLTQAYSCLAADSYVVSAGWFTFYDATGDDIDEVHHYGLVTPDGTAKPSLQAFDTVVSDGGNPGGTCDPAGSAGPAITVASPTEHQQFSGKLDLQASATDPDGLGRISFSVDDASSNIVSFTDNLRQGQLYGLTPWQGSAQLSTGPHQIKVVALDANGNASQQVVDVVKLAPGTPVPGGTDKTPGGGGSGAGTLKGRFSLPKTVTCKAGSCRLSGRLQPLKGHAAPTGKVAVSWQFRNHKGKYVKLVGGLKSARSGFRFSFKPKHKGHWRVRVSYKGVAPYKSVTSRFVYFTVR